MKEYFLSEKDGKGKGFIKNNLFIFDGTYKNGQLNGNVKEYNKEGQLTFEGEYIDGKRNGIMKKYKEGKLIFEGKYKSGKLDGYVKRYYDGILIFNGNYLGNIIFKGIYDKGKKTEGKIFNQNGDIEYKFNYNYDKVKKYILLRGYFLFKEKLNNN